MMTCPVFSALREPTAGCAMQLHLHFAALHGRSQPGAGRQCASVLDETRPARVQHQHQRSRRECSQPPSVPAKPAAQQLEGLRLQLQPVGGLGVLGPALKQLQLFSCKRFGDGERLAAVLAQLPGLEHLSVACTYQITKAKRPEYASPPACSSRCRSSPT
jgi:hypothetical protein